jgi:hypothetical protein
MYYLRTLLQDLSAQFSKYLRLYGPNGAVAIFPRTFSRAVNILFSSSTIYKLFVIYINITLKRLKVTMKKNWIGISHSYLSYAIKTFCRIHINI